MRKQSSPVNNTSSGIGFTGLLAVTFIVLKLTGVIAWPWFWVLAPIWIPLFLAVIIICVLIFCT